MIRMGNGKPGINVKEYNSRRPDAPLYYVNDFFWVDLVDYGKIVEFQNFDMNRTFSGPMEEHFFKPAWERQLKYLMALAGGSQLWQQNFLTRSLSNERVRQAIILGEKYQFVRWSWFDAYPKYYFYRIVAFFKNRIKR